MMIGETMSYIFVAKDFKAPFQVKTSEFILRKLTVEDAQKDYEAVMSSKESLRQIFRENDEWPSENMTIEDNYRDLQEHQDEFDKNEGFAYTILSIDEIKCIGCLYIYPFPYGIYDSRVYYWFIDDMKEALDASFHKFIIDWIPETFKLKKIVYPGRTISHVEFKALVEKLKG